MKWTPDKIASIILIVGCLCLVAFHIDGEIKTILGIAAGYLFATGYSERQANKINKK